jgi:hypothetical protein
MGVMVSCNSAMPYVEAQQQIWSNHAHSKL